MGKRVPSGTQSGSRSIRRWRRHMNGNHYVGGAELVLHRRGRFFGLFRAPKVNKFALFSRLMPPPSSVNTTGCSSKTPPASQQRPFTWPVRCNSLFLGLPITETPSISARNLGIDAFDERKRLRWRHERGALAASCHPLVHSFG